jgi:dihydroorotate dehydrogenase electron transfer subunit
MPCFADAACSVMTEILEHEAIAIDTMRLRVAVPEFAQRTVPGQFFMLRIPTGNDPLIGRAFALYDCAPEQAAVDVVYVVKGRLTSRLVHLRPGDAVALWGPLGNGFPDTPVQHLVMVAGGIGQTPFLTLAKEALGVQSFGRSSGYASRVSLCYGARSAGYLAGVAEFEQAGVEVHLATEDGSRGKPGRVTDALRDLLDRHLGEHQGEAQADGRGSLRIVCCGPEPMMAAVAEMAAQRNIDCEVSLETPMACGIGICFTCVAKVGTPKDWDYKRTCVEGPVFDARQIVWH